MDKEYYLTIKTDSYAGNFERELCAYCTGKYGDCEVGKNQAEDFINKFEDIFEEIVNPYVPDEHGCNRPVSLNTNDSNSLDIFFYEKPSTDQLKLLKQRAEEFAIKKQFKILEYKWGTKITSYKEEDI